MRSPVGAVIATGGDSDTLLVYDRQYLYIGRLDQTGAISSLSPASHGQTTPSVSGQLPAGVRYSLDLPGVMLHDFGPYPPGFSVLRSLANPFAFYKADILPLLRDASYNYPRIFPLACGSDDQYRCIMMGKDDAILSVLLTLQGPEFRIVEQQTIGKSSNGRIFVMEPTPGQIEILLFDLPGVTSIQGKYTPGSASPAVFNAAKQSTIPEYNMPGMVPTGINAVWNATAQEVEVYISVQPAPEPPEELHSIAAALNDLFEYLEPLTHPPTPAEANYRDVWYTVRGANGQWGPLAPAAKTCIPLGGFPDGRMCINRKFAGYELWQRDVRGDFDVEYILLQLPGAQKRSSQSLRVGIQMRQGDDNLALEQLQIRASDYATATVGGSRQMLKPRTAVTGTTDGSGTLWLSLPGESGFSFPTLYLSSARFPQRIAIDLNRKMQGKLSGLSADRLRNAKDPRDKSPILSDPGVADDLSGAVSALLENAPTPLQPVLPPANVTLQTPNGITACWIAAPVTAAAALPVPLAAHSMRSWSFSRASGTPKFTNLTHDAAQARMLELIKEGGIATNQRGAPVTAMAFDPCDIPGANYICDAGRAAFNAIKDGICRAVEFVCDAGRVVIQFVVDGVKRIYAGVLRVWQDIKDAFVFLLDAIGTLWGKFLRALLDFFFDWDAVLRQRDNLKKTVSNGANLLTTRIRDPKLSVQGFKDQLTSLQTSLLSYRRNSTDRSYLNSRTSGLPALPSMLPDFSTEISWLMEKLQDALPSFGGLIPTLKLDGFSTLESAALAKATAAGSALAPSIDDVTNVLMGLLDGGTASGIFDTLIDTVINKIAAIISALNDVVDFGAEFLHILWSSGPQIVKWLDTPLEIPGLRTFYKELFDNDLSVLDFMCAVGAIGLSVTGNKIDPIHVPPSSAFMTRRQFGFMPVALRAADSGPSRSALYIASTTLMGVGIISTAFDSFLTATVLDGSILATFVNVAVGLGTAACAIAEGNDMAIEIVASAAIGLVGLGYGLSSSLGRMRIVSAVLALLWAGNLIQSGLNGGNSNYRGLAYTSIGAVQLTGSLILRWYKGDLGWRADYNNLGNPTAGSGGELMLASLAPAALPPQPQPPQPAPRRTVQGVPAFVYTGLQSALSLGKLLTNVV
jgi:hypothetical protein